jgi:hypothetical protein
MIGSWKLFYPDCPLIAILLIAASQVSKITGMSFSAWMLSCFEENIYRTFREKNLKDL